MPQDLASAGDGPVPNQALVPQEISDSARMRGALAACESLLGDCARVAGDREETSAAQMLAAATAAKLASAAALAASAIARLEEAQTHRDLAAAKIDVTRASQHASQYARPHPAVRRARRDVSHHDVRDDWSAYSDDDEESTNNPWPE